MPHFSLLYYAYKKLLAHGIWHTRGISESQSLFLIFCLTVLSSSEATDILPLLHWPMGVIIIQNKYGEILQLVKFALLNYDTVLW
jgi:hypothetical protein